VLDTIREGVYRHRLRVTTPIKIPFFLPKPKLLAKFALFVGKSLGETGLTFRKFRPRPLTY
jgi:hypothetical protein